MHKLVDNASIAVLNNKSFKMPSMITVDTECVAHIWVIILIHGTNEINQFIFYYQYNKFG